MEDNVLKREFNQKDVKRIRDLVTKKYGEATGIQIGYDKIKQNHSEGEIFEENGKHWVYKDGIKQNITKLDKFKQLVHVPILCPKCSNPMKTQYDKKMYYIHNMCMDCVAKFETQLKIQGKYREYSDAMIKGNIKHYLKEYEEFLDNISKDTKINNFITEDGTIEKWIGNNKAQIEEAKKQLDDVKGQLE